MVAIGGCIVIQVHTVCRHWCYPCRICGLAQNRVWYPWQWSSWLYNLTPSGRAFNKCLDVLHGFTNGVSRSAFVAENYLLQFCYTVSDAIDRFKSNKYYMFFETTEM